MWNIVGGNAGVLVSYTYTLRIPIIYKHCSPEALGIVPGAIFLICLMVCLVGFATKHPHKVSDCQNHKRLLANCVLGSLHKQFSLCIPHHRYSQLLDLNSALLSICFMLFLGFTDDVLEWPWRYKLFLPSVASLPLLCCYEGSTSIVVPIPLRSYLMHAGELTTFGEFLCRLVVVDENADGSIINLGTFYLAYMGLLSVFCTNAINIYAGINGLEVGQSYIIGCSVLYHNFIEIQSNGESAENHVFSAMIVVSFLGVSTALLRYNWFPASVFVGDTYTYFAGMTFAVVGILGHFSKTLLLFFIPQILNFVWSIPQLFRFVPCPKHRLPKFNPMTGLMEPSKVMIPATTRGGKRKQNDMVNMTLINIFLQIFGPMHEQTLCIALLTFQAVCCGLGLYFRYNLAQVIFDY